MTPAVLLTLLLCAAPPGEIAFLAGASQDTRQVRVVNLQDSSITPVGPGQNDGAPVWSPNGQWLAFSTRTPSGLGIYLVQAGGMNGRLLPHVHPWNDEPAWSPDGKRLAYSAGEGWNRSIAVYDLESDSESIWGKDASPLFQPVWLPDPRIVGVLATALDDAGQHTELPFNPEDFGAYALLASGLTEKARQSDENQDPGDRPFGPVSPGIYVVGEAASFPLPHVALPSRDGDYAEWSPTPSPRGRSVAFESNDGGDREIFITTLKGSYDLSNHHTADWNPVWSPDGRWIAFESFRAGRRNIYRVHHDTNRVFPVAAAESGEDWAPSWSPDGRWIAHVSTRTGIPQLFITNIADAESIQLTHGPEEALAPAWRPRR